MGLTIQIDTKVKKCVATYTDDRLSWRYTFDISHQCRTETPVHWDVMSGMGKRYLRCSSAVEAGVHLTQVHNTDPTAKVEQVTDPERRCMTDKDIEADCVRIAQQKFQEDVGLVIAAFAHHQNLQDHDAQLREALQKAHDEHRKKTQARPTVTMS